MKTDPNIQRTGEHLEEDKLLGVGEADMEIESVSSEGAEKLLGASPSESAMLGKPISPVRPRVREKAEHRSGERVVERVSRPVATVSSHQPVEAHGLRVQVHGTGSHGRRQRAADSSRSRDSTAKKPKLILVRPMRCPVRRCDAEVSRTRP
jgi:hypothetical protein